MLGGQWSIWNFILKHLAKAQGFLDPTLVFARLQRFAQPSEVWVPTELLRSGAVLQARGLINSQAIQHNLDWIWPFWVERQFNPRDVAFIPRAFNMTHINLTHRNWTALGIPNYGDFPIVDPHGLITPFFDGWSLDGWVVSDKNSLIPSRLKTVDQKIKYQSDLEIATVAQSEGEVLQSSAQVNMQEGVPICEASFNATSPNKAWLVIAPRPYNPEGVSSINDIKLLSDASGWEINKRESVYLNQKPAGYVFSNYESGDIFEQISSEKIMKTQINKNVESISCHIGMASAAAIYELEPNQARTIVVRMPLSKAKVPNTVSWPDALGTHCHLQIPDEKFKFLYDIALRTLILHSPGEVYPGPFTYKRFWFRDAAFILHAMMTVGLSKNIEKILDTFPHRQTPLGYFMSQDGEWDSNGQALWIVNQFVSMGRDPMKREWVSSIYRAAQWIQRKRVPVKENVLHSGLLPAGFSAEHFGPSDFYYWDDFWSVAGLRAASTLALQYDSQMADRFKDEAKDLLGAIEKSLKVGKNRRTGLGGIPASPYRRLDAGAIGSLAASYPLQLWPEKDQRILDTANFLINKYFLDGAFYHEISHSGLNAYLSLHIAQVLLRAGDLRFFDVVKAVADLASPTGQWPEAIHPRTKGGCMGDGQHVWAAAEWVLMIRNMFVREEQEAKTVILCSGIPSNWLKEKNTLSLGPTHTIFGKISVVIKVQEDIQITWDAHWHGKPPIVSIRLPGYEEKVIVGDVNSITLKKM